MLTSKGTSAFNMYGFLRKSLSLLLVLFLVCLVGCDKKPAENSSTQNSLTQNSSVTSSNEQNSSTDTVTDPLSGVFTYTQETVNEEDLKQEIIPKGNTANLNNPISGMAEAKAEEKRKEILNTGNTEEYYKITGKKYYVSSINGDDSNDGTSPDKAIATVEAISGLGLKSGDAVLFERGSIFRAFSPIAPEDGVIYGSYGKGEKPKIYGSPMNFSDAEWEPAEKKNVWKIEWIYPDAGSIFFDHGKEIGCRRTGLRNVSSNYQFFQDIKNGMLYLYCDKGNPKDVFKSIEISVRMSIFHIGTGIHNVTIDNLCLKYGGYGGVGSTWTTNNLKITNCEMGYIGGNTGGNGWGRLGNAITIWGDAKNFIVENNWIYQTFDTAISWQGPEKNVYKDISFSNNLLEYNSADFEFFSPYGTVENFAMHNNILRFTGSGWGIREEDSGSRGIDGCFVGTTNTMNVKNISIKNTIIDFPGTMIVNWTIDPKQKNTEIKISNTKLYFDFENRVSTVAVRQFVDELGEPVDMQPTNEAELRIAMNRFDPKAKIVCKK